jgi:hypothetical protein
MGHPKLPPAEVPLGHVVPCALLPAGVRVLEYDLSQYVRTTASSVMLEADDDVSPPAEFPAIHK